MLHLADYKSSTCQGEHRKADDKWQVRNCTLINETAKEEYISSKSFIVASNSVELQSAIYIIKPASNQSVESMVLHLYDFRNGKGIIVQYREDIQVVRAPLAGACASCHLWSEDPLKKNGTRNPEMRKISGIFYVLVRTLGQGLLKVEHASNSLVPLHWYHF